MLRERHVRLGGSGVNTTGGNGGFQGTGDVSKRSRRYRVRFGRRRLSSGAVPRDQLDDRISEATDALLERTGKSGDALLGGSQLGLEDGSLDKSRALRLGSVHDIGQIGDAKGSNMLSWVTADLTHDDRCLGDRGGGQIDLFHAVAHGSLDDGDDFVVNGESITVNGFDISR